MFFAEEGDEEMEWCVDQCFQQLFQKIFENSPQGITCRQFREGKHSNKLKDTSAARFLSHFV